MRDKRKRCSFSLIGEKLSRIPDHEKIGAVLLVMLLGVILASSFGGFQAGILMYHALILTMLASLIYKYAKSTDAMARATIDLGKGRRRESLLSMARRVSEERVIFQEILDELQKAEMTPRPPFELSAWEHNSGKLGSLREWTDVDTDAIASCYRHLTKRNTEVHIWQDLG